MLNTNHNIRIQIDAKGLLSPGNSSSIDVKKLCKIANGDNGPWDQPVSRNFTSPAPKGGHVTWLGQLFPGQSGAYDFKFEKLEMDLPPGTQSKIVEGYEIIGDGKIIKATIKPSVSDSDKENYMIVFQVTEKSSGESGVFVLDPILRGDTGSGQAYLIKLLEVLKENYQDLLDDPVLIQKLNDAKEAVENALNP